LWKKKAINLHLQTVSTGLTSEPGDVIQTLDTYKEEEKEDYYSPFTYSFIFWNILVIVPMPDGCYRQDIFSYICIYNQKYYHLYISQTNTQPMHSLFTYRCVGGGKQ
jgi:hypothetical protein